MSRVYPEGCYVYIDPDMQPRSGSVAAVMIDGYEAVMRRLLLGANNIILSPDSYSTEYEDIIIKSTDNRVVEMIGTVVWFQSESEMD